ncbi:hypothetical protein [Streptomyces sp. NPDC058683]|uniref:hypothetical protein n=1 Tax=Streptomyces sp. NPDC058683 TaxID=3346597 RepID=UPI0036569FC8
MNTVRLLADTNGEPVLPGTPVLRMETTKCTGRSTARGGCGHATSGAGCRVSSPR